MSDLRSLDNLKPLTLDDVTRAIDVLKSNNVPTFDGTYSVHVAPAQFEVISFFGALDETRHAVDQELRRERGIPATARLGRELRRARALLRPRRHRVVTWATIAAVRLMFNRPWQFPTRTDSTQRSALPREPRQWEKRLRRRRYEVSRREEGGAW